MMNSCSPPRMSWPASSIDRVADILDIGQSERVRTKMPKRAIIVSIPTRMDDGHTEMFTGYRVQHHLSVGPTKGGLRYHPDVTLGEVAALAMWMSWKCSLCGLPYGGAKGGVTCDPRRMSRGELERMTRRFTQEMIPFIGPARRCDGARSRHQRAGHGVDDGHLFDARGQSRPANRHRQTALARRLRRPQGSDRSRRRLSRQPRAG